eukprot:331523-Pyramimonas_sp.AAC.1
MPTAGAPQSFGPPLTDTPLDAFMGTLGAPLGLEKPRFPAKPLLDKLVKGAQVPGRAISVSYPCCDIMGSKPVFDAAGLQ